MTEVGPAQTAPPRDVWSVQVLEVATAEIPGPELFWMRDFGLWHPISFHVVVLRRGPYVVLVNAGLPPDVDDYNRRIVDELGERAAVVPGPPLLDRLRDLGISPTEVTHVVVTPFQWYSTGSLPRFVDAQVCVSRRGWLHFHSTHEHPHDDRERSLPAPVLRHLVLDHWAKVRLLDDEDTVLAGVRVWWSGAHHRASVVVEVDTDRGTVAVTDCAFYRANVERRIPLGINESLAEIEVAYERLSAADRLVPLYDPDLVTDYPDGVVA